MRSVLAQTAVFFPLIPKALRIMGRCRLPEVPVDNNYLENQIRPFAQGRRVWLFAQTQQGARAREPILLRQLRARQWA
jgi:transposase